MCAPDESYHGLVYTEKFGKAAFIAKARAQMMRDIGMAMSPMNAFLLNVGIETLHLRMPVHCSNALAVAEFLLSNPKVAWVEYPKTTATMRLQANTCPMAPAESYRSE